MPERNQVFAAGPLLSVVLLAWCLSIALVAAGGPARDSRKGGQSNPTSPQSTAPAAAAQAASYAGEDTCLTCHEDRAYTGTRHGLKALARSPAATHGCESCHGPGKAHVDAGGDPATIVNPAK